MKWTFDGALAAVASALALALVWATGYRVLSLESLAALLAALALAALLSLAAGRWPVVRAGLTGLLFFAGVDIFYVTDPFLAWPLLVAGTVLPMLLHRHVPTAAFGAAALVFLVGVGLQQAQAPKFAAPVAAASTAPTRILVHWVLDEMGSFASVPEAYRVQADVQAIQQAYRDRGFVLHDDKPSRSEETSSSLSAMVDLAAPQPRRNLVPGGGSGNFRVRANGLHHLFLDQGWEVSLTQSSYLNFCISRRYRCATYNVGNSAHVFSDAGLPWGERAVIAGREVLVELLTAQRGSVLAAGLRRQFPAWFDAHAAHSWARPSLSLAMLDVLEAQALRAQSLTGQHYVFAHVLLPHFPWNLDRDCAVLPVAEWVTPYKARANRSPELRPAAFRAYWRQQYCAHMRVLALVDRLDAAHPGRVEFLIHGDHGPRILKRHVHEGAYRQAAHDPDVRNAVEPFIASRLAAAGAQDVGAAATMQDVVQALLSRAAASERADHTP